MKRLAIVSLLMVGSVALSVGPAVAQEYAPETGDLEVEVTKPIILTLSGDGFVGDSIVLITLTANGTGTVIDLGTLDTNPRGAFSGSITLPEGLVALLNGYTISAIGVTEDGATRVLSAEVSVGGEVTAETTTTTTTVAETTSTTTTSAGLPTTVLRALLAGLAAVRIAVGS